MSSFMNSFHLKLHSNDITLWFTPEQHQNRYCWNSNRHNNAEYELHIILNGSCRIGVEARQYVLQQQEAILIAPGQYHHPQASPGAFEHFSLTFLVSAGPLRDMLQKLVPSCRIISVTPELAAICRQLFQEQASAGAFQQAFVQAYLTLVILHLFRNLHLSEGSVPRSHTEEAARTPRIDGFFERHLSENITSCDLAQYLHLSRRQLARVLQDAYGMGFQEKLIQARMDRASWLLRSTEQPVIDIANAVGYTSESAFYHIFRKHFGTTPHQYRSIMHEQFSHPQSTTPYAGSG